MEKLTMAHLVEEQQEWGGITQVVLTDMISQGTVREAITYLTDVLFYGCKAGIVPNLVYYTETAEFFQDYADEIFSLVQSYEIDTQIREFDSYSEFTNQMAWLGYELAANQLLVNLEQYDFMEI